MPTARQWEKLADQVCRTLGGRHAAAKVVCPVGVRLLREVAASRLEGRPGNPARVLDSARTTIRALARLPLGNRLEDEPPDAPDDEVKAERPSVTGPKIPSIPVVPHRALSKSVARGFGGRHMRSIGTTVADVIQNRKLRKVAGFARHAVNGGFIPGESGF